MNWKNQPWHRVASSKMRLLLSAPLLESSVEDEADVARWAIIGGGL